MLAPRRPRRRHDAGQAVAEVALVLPFLVLVLLAIVQVGLVMHQQVLVTNAAREGARAAAVTPAPEAPLDAVRHAVDLDPARLDVRTILEGELVRVRVRYTARTDVPLVGVMLPDVELVADAAMRIER